MWDLLQNKNHVKKVKWKSWQHLVIFDHAWQSNTENQSGWITYEQSMFLIIKSLDHCQILFHDREQDHVLSELPLSHWPDWYILMRNGILRIKRTNDAMSFLWGKWLFFVWRLLANSSNLIIKEKIERKHCARFYLRNMYLKLKTR